MLSQTSEYALRAMVYLGTNCDRKITRSEIAAAIQMPADYLTKVLQSLGEANLVQIKRGPGGGYSLAQPATEISTYDIISAVDVLQRVLTCPLGNIHNGELCKLHTLLDKTMEMAEQSFRNTSIADLIPEGPLKTKRCKFPHHNTSTKK